MVDKQYVVKSGLHAVPWLKDFIEELVQATSEVETRGSAIFTLAVLLAVEDPDIECVPTTMLTQGFVTACFRAAARTDQRAFFTHTDAERYLILAAQEMPPIQSSLLATGFCQTINQLGSHPWVRVVLLVKTWQLPV